MTSQNHDPIVDLFTDPPPSDDGFSATVMGRIEAYDAAQTRTRRLVLGLAFTAGILSALVALAVSGPDLSGWILSYIPFLTLEATFTATTSTILALLSGMTLFLLYERVWSS